MNNFIIKLKHGTFVPGMGLVSIPTYISRSNRRGGWVLSYSQYPDAPVHYFGDYEYGSTANALKAAIVALRHEDDHLTVGRRIQTEEREYKHEKLGEVGISYSVYFDSSRGMVHYFRVNDLVNNIGLNVYIGNDNTWKDNWDHAFQRAKDLRFQCEHDYTVRNYWKSLYEVPKKHAPVRRKGWQKEKAA